MDSTHLFADWGLVKHIFSALSLKRAAAPIIVAFATTFLCSAVKAETTEERNACFNDAFRVCWSAIPDRNEVFHCLMDNRLKLNPLCRVVMDRYRHPRKHRITRSTRDTRVE